MMDAGHSSQTGLSSRTLSSPRKGTSTLTVREYEQTISTLTKENFDLKLRLFMLEKALGRSYYKDDNVPDQNPVEVIVNLSTETASLRELLQQKDEALQNALEQAEKYKNEFKELEKKCIELQTEISSLSGLPSKEEFESLTNEKESYLQHIEVLEKELGEKEQEIHDTNKRMEMLAEQNTILEEKLKKRSLAIHGFVTKSIKEKEMLPDQLRNVVISATQAAKKGNKEGLIIAMKSISAKLHQMISSSLDLDKGEEKENIKSPPTKCLKEEFLEKSSIFLPSQTESCTELGHIQSLKEVLSERNTPEIKQFDHLASFIPESFVQGKGLSESAVNIAEQDIVDHLDFSTVSPAKDENLISFSTRCSSQSCTVGEHNSVNVKIVSGSSDTIQEKETVSKPDETDECFEESQLKNVLKENEKLKLELTQKLAIIRDFQVMCKEMELKSVQVKGSRSDALKASKQHSVYTQTNIGGCDLLEVMPKLQIDAKLSSNIDELREDILLLLLAVEDKNKELVDVKETLSAVQEDLKNALNTTADKNYYMNERNEIHERLAFSCSVNEDLVKHLRNLETFMEELLQHKFDTSMDSISGKSSSLLHATKCLSESLKLSNVLSDHLSMCEGSKLFEDCESSVYKSESYADDKSFSHLHLSELRESGHSSCYQGSRNREEYSPYVRKSDQRMNIDFNITQPCWQGWKQLNAPMNKLDSIPPFQNGIVPKYLNYPSSESDIWSEPDRDISMQRIGISLQNSPVASKSPRKLRGKEKRLSSRLTSEQDTSSTNSQRLSKKRHGSTSRRLFPKDSIKNEKFYILLAEKYSNLKSLLDEFEGITNGKVSNDVWIRLNTVVESVRESLQKLHIARENAKDFQSTVCGKCVMLELLAELKTCHIEADYYVENSPFEQEILQQFSKEICLLKEACKEPFTFLSESPDKISQSTQSEGLAEQLKIDELETVILNLTNENKELIRNLNEVNARLSKENAQLESVKNENSKLSNQFKNLEEELSAVKEKEKELEVKNKELIGEIMQAESFDKKSRSTQSGTLTEQIKIDELENVILKLTRENNELNKNLNDVTATLSEEKAQLESIMNNNSKLLSQFNNVKKELSAVKEKEKDLILKNKELIEELKDAESVDKKSRSTQSEDLTEQIKIDELESEILNLTKENNELNNNLNDVTATLSEEKAQLESIVNKNSQLLSQLNNLQKELSAVKEKEKDLKLKNKELIGELMRTESHDKTSQSTQSETLTEQIKIDELESVIIKMMKKNKELSNNLDEVKAMLSKETAKLESVKNENSKLSNQFENLEKELSAVKEKEQIKIDELESVIVNLTKQNDELNNNLDNVKAMLSEEEAQLESVNKEKSNILYQCKNFKRELSAVKEQKKDLIFKNKELTEELMHAESLDKTSQSTQSETLTEQIKIDELNSVIVNLKKKNEELSNNLDEMKAMLSEERTQFESIKNENSMLSNQFENLKEELSDMKEKEKDLTFKNKKLIEKLMHAESLVKKSQSTQSEVLTEQNKIDELGSVIVKLTKENEELSNNLDEMKAMLSREKSQLESVNKENSKLSNQFENLKGKLSAVKEKERFKIDELESVIANLRKNNEELSNTVDEVNAMLLKERAQLESIKNEKSQLLNQCKILKEELSAIRKREEDLTLKNNNLIEELMHVNTTNAELNSTLKVLEEKEKESGLALNKLTAELRKSKRDLVKMNEKCLECEAKLDHESKKSKKIANQLEILESTSWREKEKYLGEIDELIAEKNNYMEQMKSIQEEKCALEKENESVKSNLDVLNKELYVLQNSNKKLQESEETLSDNCVQLQLEIKITKDQMASLQKRHGLYEEEIKKLAAKETEYCQQLQQLEFDSSNEKKGLMNKISVLAKERNDVMQKLEQKKESYEKLVKEIAEINGKYIENCELVTSLKLLNEELKNKQSSLLQRNKFFENALQSSNSECDTLSKDLKSMRETLQNLESKCLVYEKQLAASAGLKDNLVVSILNISKEFLVYRKKLNDMCKTYGDENYVLWDEISDFQPLMDEENVEKLCDNLSLESKKLLQSVDMLLGLLKNFHLKSVEAKSIAEKQDSKVTSIQSEKKTLKVENKNLKSQNDKLQKVINELQQSISEKEKSVLLSAREIQSLNEKLCKMENEIEECHQHLKEKDDEITLLQERLFNLQTYLNNIMSKETKSPGETSSFVQKSTDSKKDSVSSDNQLPSQPFSKSSKMCQTIEQELSCPKTDDSFTSTSSLETSRSNCCDKYWKKNHSLTTKLTLAKKHIEILEEEKKDLRENFLQQLQSKQDSGRRDSANSKITELEMKLEQKKAFINELKDDLLKTCNSLIDKEKQLDDLRQKLSEYEAKSKHFTFDVPDKHSISLKTVDANIKTLKNYKWRLLEKIFDIQRKFYEKKGIHLNYFDRFRDHVNNLHSMQLTHPISKSDSMPLLGSNASELRLGQEDDKIKNLVGLELDIECLGNLKIFLNRFFVPSVMDKMSQAADENEIREEEKKFESEIEKLVKEITNLKSSNFEVTDILNISVPDTFDLPLSPVHKDGIQEKSFGIEKVASNVSHHIDFIEKFFAAIKKCQFLESYNLSTQDSSNKMEVKPLLLNICQEIKIIHNRFDKIYELNSKLKKCDIIALPLERMSLSRPDISDRESVMSEETIAVSRCESPISFEDVRSVKLQSPEMLMAEPSTLEPEPLGNRVAVAETYATTKITAVGSSCDSVCQRSHYSSPDLGIESDPNHDSSAPEQKDDEMNKYQLEFLEEQKFISMSLQKSAFTCTESAGKWPGHKFGETLYAIGNLPDYELLKKEVKECLVAIKSVLARTGDGLHHIAKYTSPRKNLEYSTLKSIKDTCIHMEVCLKAAHGVVNKFWTAYCPSEKEWKHLRDQNQLLTDQLTHVKLLIHKQENEFKKAMGKLEHAQVVKASMEKKISKKLVKTKKVIRQAELKLLQNRCQNFPPVPKYPSDQSEQLLPTNPTQQM